MPKPLPPLPPLWFGKLRRHINREMSYAHAYLPGRRCDGRHELRLITGIESIVEQYKGNTEPVILWQTAYILTTGHDCGQICPTLDYIEDLVESLS